MAVPGHLEKTVFREAMASGEVVGSNELLLEEDEANVVSSASAEATEMAVNWSPADFLGQAKRLSGRLCSRLLTTQKEIINRYFKK